MTVGTITIVTRTKNRNVLLKRALDSVNKQTYTDYTHVVVNDGGNAVDVEQLVATYNDARIKVLHHTHSLGMEAASNAGIRAFPADYIAVHDDDDAWHPVFLARAVGFLESNASFVGVVCDINQVFESVKGETVLPISNRLFNPAVNQFHRNDFFVINQFVPIAFLYRASLHDKVGLYNEELSVCGDLDFHLRVLECGKIGKLRQALANYHIRVGSDSSGSMSNSIADKQNHYKYAAKVIASYDNRSNLEKCISYFRVKVWYRAINIVLRRVQKR